MTFEKSLYLLNGYWRELAHGLILIRLSGKLSPAGNIKLIQKEEKEKGADDRAYITQGLGDMVLYRLGGDIQLAGYLLIAQSVEHTKPHDLLADRRQLFDDGVEVVGMFKSVARKGVGQRGNFLSQGGPELVFAGHPAEMIYQDRAGDGHQLHLGRMAFRKRFAGLPELDIDLLGKLFCHVLLPDTAEKETEYLIVESLIDELKYRFTTFFYGDDLIHVEKVAGKPAIWAKNPGKQC